MEGKKVMAKRAKIVDIQPVQGDLVHVFYDTGNVEPKNIKQLPQTGVRWLIKNNPELYRKATGETEHSTENGYTVSVIKKEPKPEPEHRTITVYHVPKQDDKPEPKPIIMHSIPKQDDKPEPKQEPAFLPSEKSYALEQLAIIYNQLVARAKVGDDPTPEEFTSYDVEITRLARILADVPEKEKVRPGRKNKLSAEVQEQIRAERDTGATVRALAERYGVGVATIMRILEKGE